MTRHTDIAILGDQPSAGGIPRLLAQLIKAWDACGLCTDVLLFRDGQAFYTESLPSTVRFINLKTHHKSTTFLALAQYLYKTQPKIGLSCTHTANLVLSQARHLPSLRTRIVLSVHNNYLLSGKSGACRKLRQVRRRYAQADLVITTSKGIENQLRHQIGLRGVQIQTIYNIGIGSDLKHRAQEPVRHPWLHNKDRPVIIALGRLAPQKDYPTLLKAFAQLRQQRPSRLIIAGEGNKGPELKALAESLDIKSDVDFCGFLDNPYPLLASSDAFVLSSRWEGFGIVVAEALGVGTPVVATDCNYGPREILEGGSYGKLVPVGDANALAHAIAATLDGEHPVFDRDEACARFHADTIARQYLEAFGLGQAA